MACGGNSGQGTVHLLFTDMCIPLFREVQVTEVAPLLSSCRKTSLPIMKNSMM